MKRVRLVLAFGCFVLCIWFLMPIGLGVFHIGMVYPVLLLLLAAAVLLNWQRLRPLAVRHRFFTRLAAAVLCVGLLLILIPVGFMGAAALNAPPEKATVVVLGCQVRGRTPSLMLADRCHAAYEYLLSHPDAVCIASGGRGDGEDISEARAIYGYLTDRGIDGGRILLEEHSANTAENIANCAALIREQGLSSDVAVVTDSFHQLRASLFAGQNGLTAYAVGCATRWYLAPGYWAREVPGIYRALVLGY